MNALYKQYTEKLKELNTLLNNGYGTEMVERWEYEQKSKLESELASLEQQIEAGELADGWKELENSGLDKPFEQIEAEENEQPINGNYACGNWMPDEGTSATRCKNCGKDRWQHSL